MGDEAGGDGRRVIVFDGVCSLCNRFVDFVIRRDPAGALRFASNQSEAGRALLRSRGVDDEEPGTVYFVEPGRIATKSTAALRIAGFLRFPWSLARWLLVVPRPIRDWAYDRVARNRYAWFGKSETCRIPTPEERARFLEDAPTSRT